MNLLVNVLYIVAGLILLFFIALWMGRVFKKRWQKEFDETALLQEGGKFITNTEGRRIEYFVYGIADINAPVVVNIHGSWLEALFEKWLYEDICEQLSVRGIAISLPWMGYTDIKIGRTVINWVEEDLEPVLEKENVKDFVITGHSQGAPHAMAAAYHCKKRCTWLGLNAPLLPNHVTKDIKLEWAIGAESLLTTEQLQQPLMSWYFTFMYLIFEILSPWLTLQYLFNSTPRIKEDVTLVERIKKSSKRSLVRGSLGNTWETAKDVCYDRWFDPRLIDVNNICIWHAKDDAQCPPSIGNRLANHFSQKNIDVTFKDEAQGFGHFTYCRGEYLEPNNSMIHALTQSLKD